MAERNVILSVHFLHIGSHFPKGITAWEGTLPLSYFESRRPKLPVPDTTALRGPNHGSGSSLARAKPRRCVEVEDDFLGLWISEGGSLYSFDGNRFVCETVHSNNFRGWIGTIAVDGVFRIGSFGTGRQAFRNGATGVLSDWVSITLTFEKDTVTKHFPSHVPSGILVYGHVERYFRV